MPLTLSPEVHALAARVQAHVWPAWRRLERPQPWDPATAAPIPLPGWQVAPPPPALRARRCELIVEANDWAAAQQAALVADAVVLDFDDVFSPTTANLQAAYAALDQAAAHPGVFLTRPRPLAHTEPRVSLRGQPAIAGVLDLCAHLQAFLQRERLVYLPKLDSLADAAVWEAAIGEAERALDLPYGAVRVCLQIETLPGLLQAEALLHHFRHRAYGLNAGRWDYVFSVLKHRPGQAHLPRRLLGMDQPAMRAYAARIVAVCRASGAEAIGGTASLAPDPRDPGPVLAQVRADKQREADQGFTAAWAGLPELAGVVREVFAAAQPAPPLPDPTADLLAFLAPALLDPQDAADAVGVAAQTLAAWLDGRGSVLRAGRVEDTATAELARTALHNWHAHGLLSRSDYLWLRRAELPDDAPAARLLDALVLAPEAAPYFPPLARQMGLLP